MHLWWVMSLKWAPYHIFLSHISSNCITRNNHKKVLKKSYVKCYFLGITLISHNLLNSCPPQKEKLASVSVFCGCWLCSLQQLSTIPGIKQFQCHYRCCDTRREQRNLLSTHDLSIRQFIAFERSQIKKDNLQNNIVAIKYFHEMLVTWLTWLSNNSKSISWLCPLHVAIGIFVSVTYKMQGAEFNKLQTLPLKWYHDQIFPLDFFSVSHRISWKNKNAICRLQISP